MLQDQESVWNASMAGCGESVRTHTWEPGRPLSFNKERLFGSYVVVAFVLRLLGEYPV